MKGCGWCGAFMCPAMIWLDCGQRFQCSFCGKLNEGKTENGEAKAEALKKTQIAGAQTSSLISVWMQIISPVQTFQLQNPRTLELNFHFSVPQCHGNTTSTPMEWRGLEWIETRDLSSAWGRMRFSLLNRSNLLKCHSFEVFYHFMVETRAGRTAMVSESLHMDVGFGVSI